MKILKELAGNGRVQFAMCFVAAAAIVGVMEVAKDDKAPVPAESPDAPKPEAFRNAIPVQVVRP
ncbi:MAG: hypothetical protein ACXW30_05510 [Micavibrio sp.]